MAGRISPQDGIQPSLADDHVHLLAQPSVAEQLLDVQQTAVGPVDGVFGSAVAVDSAADGDLGVVDVQGPISVVDGQGDLSPAQGRPGGGAGEDHVLHGSAAQALGPLLAHDPGQGVDDVGFA